jgi:transcriptional regulator with XRE-family HTH domain
MQYIRNALHLTQSEIAQKLGYNSKDAISKVERGERNLSGVARKFLEYIEENEL